MNQLSGWMNRSRRRRTSQGWMKKLERISQNSSLSLSSRCGGAFDPPKDSLLLSSAPPPPSPPPRPPSLSLLCTIHITNSSSLLLYCCSLAPLECRFLFLLLSLQLFPYTYPLTTATRSLCALWGVLHPWWFFNSTTTITTRRFLLGISIYVVEEGGGGVVFHHH